MDKEEELPFIDVVVPTYNRPQDIKNFLHRILEQDYPRFKVYVVDDASVCEIRSLLPEDERVMYIPLPVNKGQTYARNVGIASGEGSIIVSLDDDAWFMEQGAFFKIINYFKKDKATGCLMFNIKQPDMDFISAQRNLSDYHEIGSHITCGCAYKRSALTKVGGFTDFLHSGAEETDVSLKLIRENYKMRFTCSIKVFHNYLPDERSKSWYLQLRHNITRNDMMIVLMRYPLLLTAPFFIAKYLSHIIYSASTSRDRFHATLATCSSLFSLFNFMPEVARNRKPLSMRQFRYWYKLRW